MIVGQRVFNAFVGTESGSMASVRPVYLVKRTPSAWIYSFKQMPNSCTFRCNDSNKNQRIFEEEVDAYDWLIRTLRRRVCSAEDVLLNRKAVLEKFELERSMAQR